MTLNHETKTKSGFSFFISELLDKVIFIILVALIPLITIPYGSIDPLPETIFNSIIFIIAAFWVLHGALSGKLFVKQHVVLIPCAAIIVYAALQTIPFGQLQTPDANIRAAKTLSFDPYETRHVVIRFAAYALYGAMLLRYISNLRRLRWLVYIIIASATASALFGFYLQTTVRNRPESFLPRILTTRGFAQFLSKNNFAYFMEMAIGLAAGILIGRGASRKSFAVYIAAILMIIGGLVLSLSRGGILSLLVQSLCVGLILVFSRYKRENEESGGDKSTGLANSIFIRAAAALGLVLAIGIGVLWFGGDSLMTKLESTPTDFSVGGEMEKNLSRKQIWRDTLRLFKDNAITGVGFGGYWIGITNYDDTSGNLSLQQAHNEYLEILASGGLFGLILVAWLCFLIAKRVRRSFSADGNKFRRAAFTGALIGCLGIAIHNIFDFGLHTPIIAFTFIALLAIALYVEIDETQYVKLSRPVQVALAIIGISACLFSSWINMKRGSGRVISESAARFSKARNNDPKQYIGIAQMAIDSAPNDPETYAAMALVLERTGDEAGAVKFYEKALSLRPLDYTLWLRLGRMLEHTGDVDKAIVAFREAVKLAKPYARPKWLLGNALLRAGGHADEALTELKKAAERDPLLVKQVIPIAWNVFDKNTTEFLRYIDPKSDDEKLIVGKFLFEQGKNKEGLELLFEAGEKGKDERASLITELMKQNRVADAYEIWARENNEKGGIANGSFEKDINLSETMFGWRIEQNKDGVKINLETNSVYDGQRALVVTYADSKDFTFSPLSQLVAVNPNTKYHLSFTVKTQELISGGLPAVKIIDTGVNKIIAESKAFPTSTSSWEKMDVEFTTEARTKAIYILLTRENCTNNPCPIFGKVWLDKFELTSNGQ